MKTLFTFYYALKDPRTPWYSKLTALLSIVYLLSPADILPDIIPLAGYVDDIIIVPFLLNVATKLLPADVRAKAEQRAVRNSRKLIWAKVLLVILVLAVMVGLYFAAVYLYEQIK
ncbi:MAG: DUF1232 domain-containing protein [Chitinophagaceae bacterium]|nr:DUF1232 domain-containing protein [Chitinophagaceae bacterium]